MTDYSDAHRLVSEAYPELFFTFVKLTNQHQDCEQKITQIISDSISKRLFRFPVEIKFLDFAFPTRLDIEPQFCGIDDKLDFDTFTIDLSILYRMVQKEIVKLMEEEYIPYPKIMIIGRCLQDAVIRGRLPKRFKSNVMDFDLNYDSGIDGIVFI